jgi:hypothetical protein
MHVALLFLQVQFQIALGFKVVSLSRCSALFLHSNAAENVATPPENCSGFSSERPKATSSLKC